MIECGLLRLLLLLNNSRVGVACDAAWDNGDKKAESSANYRNLIHTKTQRRKGLSYWQQTGRTTTTTNPALDLKSAPLHVFRNILKRLLLLERAVVSAAVLAPRLPHFTPQIFAPPPPPLDLSQKLCLQRLTWSFPSSGGEGATGSAEGAAGGNRFFTEIFPLLKVYWTSPKSNQHMIFLLET
jgi:hypothetical protein